jgi:hypothetical protein
MHKNILICISALVVELVLLLPNVYCAEEAFLTITVYDNQNKQGSKFDISHLIRIGTQCFKLGTRMQM